MPHVDPRRRTFWMMVSTSLGLVAGVVVSQSFAWPRGIVGVAGGVFAAGRLAAQFGWPVLIQLDIIIISVGFSALVGIVFGLYPARKASQLDPIDALRYE